MDANRYYAIFFGNDKYCCFHFALKTSHSERELVVVSYSRQLHVCMCIYEPTDFISCFMQCLNASHPSDLATDCKI